MHVTLRHLRAAQAVAQHSSFRRAAETVHVSQPALSLAIAELERALGVTLFDRTSRSVRTTELGAYFLSGSARILADLDRLLQEVGDQAHSRRGRVVVSCVSSIAGRVMPLAIERCEALYPAVDVIVRDDVATQVLESVRARDADFGLTIAPARVPQEMLFEPLKEDRFHLVCTRGHRLARRKRVAWHELGGESLVALSTSSGTHQMISDELVRHRVVLKRSTPVSHLSTVHGMLEAGFGIGILPVIALPLAGHPTLVAIPLVKPELCRTIGALRLQDRSLSPAASAFLQVLREVLDALP